MTKADDNTAAFFEEKRRNTPACCRCGEHLEGAHYHWNTPPHCWRCEASVRLLRKARAKWGNRFDYSKEEANPRFFDLYLTCNACGSEFKTNSIQHLDNPYGGCKECDRRARAAAFVAAAETKHGRGRYIYDTQNFKAQKRLMIIKCLIHGPYQVTGVDHVKHGKGCPQCAPTIKNGWSRSDFVNRCEYNNRGRAYLYVIQCYRPNEPDFIKIGITSKQLNQRFNSGNMPYNYKTLVLMEGSAAAVYDLERTLLRLNKAHAYEPALLFGGYTECFDALEHTTATVLGLM